MPENQHGFGAQFFCQSGAKRARIHFSDPVSVARGDRQDDRNGPLAAQICEPTHASDRAVGAGEAAVDAAHADGMDSCFGELVDDLTVEVPAGPFRERFGLWRREFERAVAPGDRRARGFERALRRFAETVDDDDAVAAGVVAGLEVPGEAGQEEGVAEVVGVEVEDEHRGIGRGVRDEKPLAAFHMRPTGPLQAILRTPERPGAYRRSSFVHTTDSTMRSLRIPAVAVLAAAFAMAGCDNGPNTRTYTADLSALNGSGASGVATITVDNESNVVSVSLTASGLDDTIHAQHVHSAGSIISSCPTAADDANSDGYVDVVEGLPKYGPIILPLDNDISGADANVSGFPTGTSIDYTTSAPRADVADAVDNDGFLDFQDWAIVVHGTTEDLPSTVATLPGSGLSNQVTLPVACGAIRFQ